MTSYVRKDRFYEKAKREGYPSRAAYKLIEMDRRFGILKPHKKIVDLGCAPGGWLKVAEEKIASGNPPRPPLKLRGGEGGLKIVGIDILPLQYQPSDIVAFLQGDFLVPENRQKIVDLLGGKADWVLSDLSPNITGIRFKDTQASTELCEAALEFAETNLAKGGGLVVKIFPGVELADFKKRLKGNFEHVATFIPEATRKTSTEIYLVATGFRPQPLG